jgi:hypothetical protein
VAYNPDTEALTINFGAFLPRAEFDEDFPIDFDLDLGPLINIESDTVVNVSASVGFDEDFTLGVYLGDEVPGALADLSTSTLLSELNNGKGVDIKTEPAITASNAVVSAVRQPSGVATFDISFNNGVTKYTVVVPHVPTATGTVVLSTLLADINTAIDAALPDEHDNKIQAVADGNRIVLKSLEPDVDFSLTAAQADPAVKDLGFNATQMSTGPLAGDSLETFNLVGGDAKFTLTIGDSDYPVTVTQLWTLLPSPNSSIDHLVADVNQALLAALPGSLDNKIVADKSGNRLVLRIADASITEVGFSAAIDDPTVLELGLTNEATITQPRIEAVKDLALVVGRLQQDARITITTTGGTGPLGTFTVFADDTGTNSTILSLVNDLNDALAESIFADKFEADSVGNKLILSAVDPAITAFTVNADAGAAAMGLATGPTLSSNVDFEIYVSNPGVGEPNAYTVVLDDVSDIQGVINQIQTATSGAVSVQINDAKTGLTLIDKTFVEDGTNNQIFMLMPVNGSAAAAGLGIIGVDALTAAELDGKIDGGQLLGVKLTDRFYMHDATLVASLDVTTPGGIDASANFGFVGIGLTGNADLSAELSVGLKDPTETGVGADGNISLTEFINALSNGFSEDKQPNVQSLLNPPSLTGLGQLDLDVSVDGVPFITVTNASIGLAVNVGDLFDRWADEVDLSAASPTRMSDTAFDLTGDFSMMTYRR